MPVARPVSSDARVIAHVDMDCFYVQVEQRKQPELRGLPTAVVQYNEWKGGGLIAVGYEARKVGVKRSMRGDEAKALCPQIQLVQVPVSRGKADLSIYRNAGSEVVSILSRKGRCERASIDEVYLDLTDAAETMLAENLRESLEVTDEETLKSHILGLDQEEKDVKENVRDWFHRSDADHADKLLACGALIVAELRRQVLKETEFTCSAGVAHNKMLAKLASGMNKPAQQTVVPSASVKELLRPLPIKKMKQLGGKLGDSLLSDLGVSTVGDLLQFSEQKLQECYGVNTGTWLWSIARGISGEEVEGRILPKSHGSGKTFPGPRALRSFDTVSHWLNKLCEELSERVLADLEQNKRIAHTLTLHVSAYKLSDTDSQKNPPSKSCQLRYGVSKMQEDALSLFHTCLREFMGIYGVKGDKKQNNGWGVTGLSVSASKILDIPKGTCSIMKFFPSQFVVPAPSSQDGNEKDDIVQHSGIAGNSEPNVLTGSEENTTKDHMLDLDSKETRKYHNVQGTCSIMKFFPSQFVVPAPSSQDGNEKDDIVQHSGIAGNSESNVLTGSEENTTKDHTLDLDSKETRKYHKDQGPTSILRFLKRFEPAPSWSTDEQNKKTCMPSSSGNDEIDGLPQTGENAERRESWSYKVGEIDPDVIKELPLDIQAELRGWMHPMKQPHSSKRRCITSYFSPS